MPPPYLRHVFVCTNRRAEGNPKGSCAQKGSESIHQVLKREVHRLGLKGEVRVNSAGCLDACERGPAMVVYPEGVWYGPVRLEDVPAIVEEHLRGGRPVERLKMAPYEREKP